MNHNGLLNIVALGTAMQTFKLCTEATLLRIFRMARISDFDDRTAIVNRLNELKFLNQKIYVEIFDKGIELIQQHRLLAVEVISIFDPRYPKSLLITSRPPALLYARGNLDLLCDNPGVAVVGSREVSSAGAEITRRVVNRLVKENYCIVSGLAIGVDSAAHRAAISSKGKTIAVLAHGLEEAKPKQNARLGEEILECGGMWVSEYPIGRAPSKPTFVQRNRIQVGLSAGSVIIEAALNSGSMTQAEFCHQERRPLFCVVPEDVSNRLNLNCEGTQSLVNKSEAYPLRNREDYEYLVTSLNKGREMIASNFEDFSKINSFL